MRTKWQLVVSTIVVLLSLPMAAQERGGQRGAPAAPAGPAMTLTIPAFPDGGQFPVKYSQAAEGVAPGEGTSPAISWANPPAGTQSFVLNMRDMDVARNRTTDDQAHWVVWNIPGTAPGLPEGVPKGPQLADGSLRISATGQSIAVPVRRQLVPSITTCSSSTRWTPSWMSSRPATPSRRARTS